MLQYRTEKPCLTCLRPNLGVKKGMKVMVFDTKREGRYISIRGGKGCLSCPTKKKYILENIYQVTQLITVIHDT